MERAEDVVTAQAPAAGRSMPRWLWPSFAGAGLILGAGSLVLQGVSGRIAELNGTLESQRELLTSLARQNQALEKEAAGTREQTAALKMEVQSLRHFLASSSSEDVIFLKITLLKPDIDAGLAREIARHTHRYAELYGRDSNLVLAMIATESNFNPKVVSSAGAVGLMQVMPQWKKVLGIDGDLADIELSIKYGLQVLGFYTEMYKDMEMALTAYNRGPGPVDMALMRGQDPKNRYAPRVLATYERLKKLTVRSVGS